LRFLEAARAIVFIVGALYALGPLIVTVDLSRLICSPSELDTDGAILLRQDGRASWASFHGSRTADASSPVEFKRGVVQQLLKGEKTLARRGRASWTSSPARDNGPQYTATVSVALRPRARPDALQPGEQWTRRGLRAHTFERDYVSVHDLHDAETVLAQLGQWFDDYNRQAPHSALGMRPPAEYRASLDDVSPENDGSPKLE
jgi:hypothetical protein